MARSALRSVSSLVFALLVGIAFAGRAGVIEDVDSDLIPDVLDNCTIVANGPDGLLDQTDSDDDGFGNGCDCDFTQEGLILGDDLLLLFAQFNMTTDEATEVFDQTGDGFVLGDDISACFGKFGGPPGPAGPL
jgi:hypothetical protein